MKRRILALAVVAAFLLVGGGLTWWEMHHKPVASPQPAPQAKPPAPAVQLDPLEIDAIRQRSYPGSAITTESNLGSQGGYHNQIVSYRSDGFKIYALVSIPDSAAPAGGYPVIILDHGYINPADYRTDSADYQQFIATYARAGFVVIKPDYRGHGKSEGVPEGGHFSPAYTYDNLNLIASLKRYSPVNATRLGVIGHSLGGHTALRTAVVSSDVKATVIAAGVVGSMYDIFYNWPHSPMPNDQPKAIVADKRNSVIAAHGEPKTNPDFWNKVSAVNYVSAVVGSVQIHHDEVDSTVPFLFSQHLDEAFKKAGKTDEFYSYPGDNHQFGGSARALFLQRSLAFFQAHL